MLFRILSWSPLFKDMVRIVIYESLGCFVFKMLNMRWVVLFGLFLDSIAVCSLFNFDRSEPLQYRSLLLHCFLIVLSRRKFNVHFGTRWIYMVHLKLFSSPFFHVKFKMGCNCCMLLQVGGSILAGKVAKERGWAINVGGGFHHCSAEQGGGFCVYADISLCIHYAFVQLNISRYTCTMMA